MMVSERFINDWLAVGPERSIKMHPDWMNNEDAWTTELINMKIPIGYIYRVHCTYNTVATLDNVSKLVLVIGTRLGNFVMFQPSSCKDSAITFRCSKQLDHLLSFTEPVIGFNEYNRIMSPLGNVGQWVEEVYQNLLAT